MHTFIVLLQSYEDYLAMSVFVLLCLVGAFWSFRKHLQVTHPLCISYYEFLFNSLSLLFFGNPHYIQASSPINGSNPSAYSNVVEDSHLHLLQLPHINAATDTNTRPHLRDSSVNGSHAKTASLLHAHVAEKGGEEGDEEGAFETYNL